MWSSVCPNGVHNGGDNCDQMPPNTSNNLQKQSMGFQENKRWSIATNPPPPASFQNQGKQQTAEHKWIPVDYTGSKYPYTPDFENSVIQRQRRELQQLVAELRERDQELNELVAGHRRQMEGWEADRKRLVQVEEKARKMEAELGERHNHLKSLQTRLTNSEEKLGLKNQEISRYQTRLDALGRETGQYKTALKQMEEQNEAMERRMRQLASSIEHLESREQEMKGELRLKESEVHKREQDVNDLIARYKMAESSYASNSQNADLLQQQLDEANACLDEERRMNQNYKNEATRLNEESRECLEANERLQNEILQLRKDIQLAVERERRKDDLIQSQKLKQERSDSEIAHLRQLYERMQRDLSTLHSNLASTRGALTSQSNSALDKIGHNQNQGYSNPKTFTPLSSNPAPLLQLDSGPSFQASSFAPPMASTHQKPPQPPTNFHHAHQPNTAFLRPSSASTLTNRLATATSISNQLLYPFTRPLNNNFNNGNMTIMSTAPTPPANYQYNSSNHPQQQPQQYPCHPQQIQQHHQSSTSVLMQRVNSLPDFSDQLQSTSIPNGNVNNGWSTIDNATPLANYQMNGHEQRDVSHGLFQVKNPTGAFNPFTKDNAQQNQHQPHTSGPYESAKNNGSRDDNTQKIY